MASEIPLPTALEVLEKCELFPEQHRKDEVKKILQSLDLTSESNIQFSKASWEFHYYYIVQKRKWTSYYMYSFHLSHDAECKKTAPTIVKLYDADQLLIELGIVNRVNSMIEARGANFKIDQHTVSSYDRTEKILYMWNCQSNTAQFGVVRLDLPDNKSVWYDLDKNLAQNAISIYYSDYSPGNYDLNAKFHFMMLVISSPNLVLNLSHVSGTKIRIDFQKSLDTYFLSWTSLKGEDETLPMSSELEIVNKSGIPTLIRAHNEYPAGLDDNPKFDPVERKRIYLFMKNRGLIISEFCIVDSKENETFFYIKSKLKLDMKTYHYSFRRGEFMVGNFKELEHPAEKLIDAGIHLEVKTFLDQNGYAINRNTTVETSDNVTFYIWEKTEKYLVFFKFRNDKVRYGRLKHDFEDLTDVKRIGELAIAILYSTDNPDRSVFIEALLNSRNSVSVFRDFPFMNEPDAKITFTKTSIDKYTISWGDKSIKFKIAYRRDNSFLYPDDEPVETKEIETKDVETIDRFPHREEIFTEFIKTVENYLADEVKKARANKTYRIVIGKELHLGIQCVIDWILKKCDSLGYGHSINSLGGANEFVISLLG